MVKRAGRGMFGSLVVFPGGTIDDEDLVYAGSIDAPQTDLEHRAAALRELAEETGLLAIGGELVAGPRLHGPELYRWLETAGRVLDVENLVMVSRWVTPEYAPQRYDTRFYLLPASGATEVRIDRRELVDHDWVTPGEALARAESGAWAMILPTMAHLRWLGRRESIADAISSARGADGRTLIRPRRVEDGSLVPIHLPAEQ
jgi:8-oxo-dGTP pyrophosphatase MutT (NUDIX family)